MKPVGLFERADIIPGLGLDQPYAGLARLKLKDLETRMFTTHQRGEFVVCATMKTQRPVLEAIRKMVLDEGRCTAEEFDEATSLLGCHMAQVELVGCRNLEPADLPRSFFWSNAEAGRRKAWELENIRPTVPNRVRCMPGFFSIPREQVRLVSDTPPTR